MNRIFDKIVCINLDHRTDRWEVCRRFFEENNLLVERVPGVYHRKGQVGCAKAHLNVVRLALDQNLNNILILEDDFEFLEYHSEKVIGAFRELPAEWDMFYLGFNPTTALIDYSPALYRINGAHTTHAYALNRSVLPYIILKGKSPIDEFYRRMHPSYNVFGLKPGLCTQTGSFSDVDKGATNNRQTIIDSNNKYRSQLP